MRKKGYDADEEEEECSLMPVEERTAHAEQPGPDVKKIKKRPGFDKRLLKDATGVEQSVKEARAACRCFKVAPASVNFNQLHVRNVDQSDLMSSESSYNDELLMADFMLHKKQKRDVNANSPTTTTKDSNQDNKRPTQDANANLRTAYDEQLMADFRLHKKQKRDVNANSPTTTTKDSNQDNKCPTQDANANLPTAHVDYDTGDVNANSPTSTTENSNQDNKHQTVTPSSALLWKEEFEMLP
jgi:hypothetical protein